MPTAPPPVQSLDRGLALLLAVGQADQPMSLSQLQETLPLDRSSIFRLLKTLQQRGFLMQDPATKSFRLGPTIWRLADHMRKSNRLLDQGRRHVAELAAACSETAHLAVREGTSVVFLDYELTDHALAVGAGSGRVEPLHCTALGKALLVDMDQSELRELFGSASLKAYSARTITARKDLLSECGQTRERGYALDNEEFRPGIRCIASTVRDFSGRVVAAIGISAPTTRLPKRQFRTVGGRVGAAAEALSEELGWISHGELVAP